MMLPNASDLRYFLEVAKTLNLSRASERLGITQPALTFAIRRIEQSLGQEVFIRSRVGVRLTRAGAKLVTSAHQLLREWERLANDLSKEEIEIAGRYTIGVHVSVSLYTLKYFLPQLLKKNPGLQVSLSHDLSRRITEGVINFATDIGIVVNPVRHPDLVIKPLFEDRVCLWHSAGEFNKDVLIFEPDLMQSQHIVGALAKAHMNFQRTIMSSSLEVIGDLIASGAGYGILPTRVAHRVAAEDRRLVSYKEKDFRFIDKICLIYRPDLNKSVGSRRFISEISEALISTKS